MIAKLTHDEVVNRIMKFEGGNLTIQSYLELFSYLIATGQAWTLQGMYGRTAKSLIDAGLLERNGEITQKAQDEYWEQDIYLYDE